MTPCEKKGYKVGQVFEVIEEATFSTGSLVALSHDDQTDRPLFDLIKGECHYKAGVKTDLGAYAHLDHVKRVYPPEEKSPTVDIIVEGKTKTISREAAIALNLVEE